MRSRYVCSKCNKLFFGLGSILHHFETCQAVNKSIKHSQDCNQHSLNS